MLVKDGVGHYRILNLTKAQLLLAEEQHLPGLYRSQKCSFYSAQGNKATWVSTDEALAILWERGTTLSVADLRLLFDFLEEA